MLIVTTFAVLPPTMNITSTSPRPIKLRGIRTLLWSRPAKPAWACAARTSASSPPMKQRTFSSPLCPRKPVPKKSRIFDDSGGTPRDLSPYADFIDFCGRDFFDPTVSIKEIVIQGPWDDKASTGSDVVLAGILGTVVTVSFGPAGNGSG